MVGVKLGMEEYRRTSLGDTSCNFAFSANDTFFKKRLRFVYLSKLKHILGRHERYFVSHSFAFTNRLGDSRFKGHKFITFAVASHLIEKKRISHIGVLFVKYADDFARSD